MPDWKKEIRGRIERLNLAPETEEEVIAELASHFEDDPKSDGLRNISDLEWRKLSRAIECAKSQEDLMNHRTKSLWLPALVTFLAASVSLMVCQLLGMQPRLVWVARMGMTFYWPWLGTLPFFGAAGAYVSRRAHGSFSVRLTASLSPALVILVVMLVILPWGLHIDGVDFFRLVAFGLGLVNWVVIPAIALLLGALPFLKRSEMREAQAA